PGQIATRHCPGVTLSEKEPSAWVTVSAYPPPAGWKAPTNAPATAAPGVAGSLLRKATCPWILASLETSWTSPTSTVAPSPALTASGGGPPSVELEAKTRTWYEPGATETSNVPPPPTGP